MTVKRISILALWFLLLGVLPCHAWKGKVVGVSDGDTIKVLKLPKAEVKIRLYGVDTPEKKQAFGAKAKRFTSDLVFGEVVDVHEITRDRYSRTVAIVMKGNKCLNEELIAAGFAWVYRKYCDRQPLCLEWMGLEAKARDNKKGLWKGPNPTPPWEWRKKR